MHTCKTVFTACLLGAGLLMAGCTRYLDAKPNKALVVPGTPADAYAMMQEYNLLHASQPMLAFLSADDFYLADSYVAAAEVNDRDAYLWQTQTANTTITLWRNPYAAILLANTAIPLLENAEVPAAEAGKKAAYLGKAYFIRAWHHYTLANLFAAPYREATAGSTPGIPIKLLPDLDEPVRRGTLADTYRQIIGDVNRAIRLLPPPPQPAYLPDRSAALLLRANIALHMHQYDSALAAGRAALALRPGLINYNTLSAAADFPFQRFNAEVLYHAIITGSGMLSTNNWRCDTGLYRQYETNDLRRSLFFKLNGPGAAGFRGDYGGEGEIDIFCGLSNNETYLIVAECEARAGNTAAALQVLNTLLAHRWRTGTFVPYAAATATEALALVLAERRKELVGRHNRWYDLRRLNAGHNAGITLQRRVGSNLYQLPPNDLRYTFLIPQAVIDLAGIAQNPR